VCALTIHGHFANRIRVPWTSVASIPEEMSWEMAASFVLVFITAWYSLFDAARVEPGETVMVHAASGGVGQACIILLQSRGIEVFATIGTEEKRDFVRTTYGIPDDHIFSSRDASFADDVLAATEGRGVDVVINSLAGKLLHESWNIVAPHGRFVEIGKRDIRTNKSLDMEPFRKGLSFMAVDVVQLADNKGLVIQRILQELVKALGSGTMINIGPVTIFPLTDIGRAMRTMQAGKHIGKIVIVPGPEDLVKAAPPPKITELSPDASYLVVGGLTGIGRSISRWLIDHGAKHLLLISRNASSRPEHLQFGQELTFTGATVSVESCDVGDKAMLKRLVEKRQSTGMPPIRGVVHSGMLLDVSSSQLQTQFYG
jgi:NADPH:quinone reductase-like Zn-dependent oxidoreductase